MTDGTANAADGETNATTATATPSPEVRPGMKRRVRECHTCPLNGKGDDYCWKTCLGPADVSEKGQVVRRLGQFEAPDEFINANRLDDPNALPSASHDPASGVSLWDDLDDGETANAAESDPDGDTPDDFAASPNHGVTAELTDDVERALVPIIANLMSLSDTQLCIFRHVFHGEDLRKTGQSLPVPMTKQAVSKHLKRICEQNDVVARVIRGMMREGHGGAHPTRKSETQLTLFDFKEAL
jgi:hypothetical protein